MTTFTGQTGRNIIQNYCGIIQQSLDNLKEILFKTIAE